MLLWAFLLRHPCLYKTGGAAATNTGARRRSRGTPEKEGCSAHRRALRLSPPYLPLSSPFFPPPPVFFRASEGPPLPRGPPGGPGLGRRGAPRPEGPPHLGGRPPPAPRVRERHERGPRRLFSIPGRGSRVAARRRSEGVPRPAVRPGPPAERGGPGAPGRAGGVSAFRFFSLPAAPLPGPTLAPSLLLVFPRPAAPLPSSFSLSVSLSRSPHISPPPAALCPRPTETPRRVSRPPGDPGSGGGGRACVCLV